MKKLHDTHTIAVFAAAGVLVVWFGDGVLAALSGSEFKPNQPVLKAFLTICFLAFPLLIARILQKNKPAARPGLQGHSTALEASMDGIAIYDVNLGYRYVNQAYATINGYDSPREIIGNSCRLAYGEQEFSRMQQMIGPALRKSGKWRGELIARRKNGSTYIQEASVSLLEDGGRICIVRDITWRKRSEERLQRSERFLNTIFNSIRDPFCIFDCDFRIIRVNDAYAQLKNKSLGDLIGRKCHEVLEGNECVCEACVVNKTFHSADPCAKDKLVALHDGTRVWVEIYTYPILDEEGKVSHVIEYTRDITDRKKSEDEKRRLIDRLEYLSRTDVLTGLINRRALADSLVYEMDRAKRYRSELSLILCDLDNFKEINDAYGHDTGDRALQTVSATLKSILRRTDIAGRYGGDEFMLILPETSLLGAESLADKILLEIRNTDLRLQDGRIVSLSMSIGVAGISGPEETVDSLVKRADDAMYRSKQGGRDRVSTTGV
jgi:diguanylate cyclase (GGDEF)-like protein/PAS domain S-box-containing protein